MIAGARGFACIIFVRGWRSDGGCLLFPKRIRRFGGITLRRSGGAPVKLWSVRRLKRCGRITLWRGSSEALERKVI